jgi:coproporphyrinogen III oxidase
MCSHEFYFSYIWNCTSNVKTIWWVWGRFDLVYYFKFNKSSSIVENHIRFHKKKLKPCENNHVIFCQWQHSKKIYLNK